ncbi:MAG: hypothetical protein HGB28_04910, partial [Oscillochloris sp.]|nr:hypothetical protein [Oscillochloris sp.]
MRAHSFNRPPRVRPRWPTEEVALPAPPAPPARQHSDRFAMLMPLVGAGLMVSVTLSGGGNWLFALPTGAMAGLGVVAALRSERAAVRRDATEHATRVAFLVGGVGITPARSMLREAVSVGRVFDDVLLVYGNRDATCIPYHEELLA